MTAATTGDNDDKNEHHAARSNSWGSILLKLGVASGFVYAALWTTTTPGAAASSSHHHHHRRLESANTPSYMNGLVADLQARKQLFDDTPEQEIKYWFEYAGPLQVSAGWAWWWQTRNGDSVCVHVGRCCVHRVDEMRCKKSLLLRRRRGFRAALVLSPLFFSSAEILLSLFQIPRKGRLFRRP